MKNNTKLRKFKSLGIFCPNMVRGKLVTSNTQKAIYSELKKLGYKETIWQYSYEGQLGGLVLATPDNNEVHVRFYNDRIFAEYERGRAYLSHFFGPRFNAAVFLSAQIKDKLSEKDWASFRDLTDQSNLYKEELKYRMWIEGTKVQPLRKNLISKTLARLQKSFELISWQLICIILLFALSGIGIYTGFLELIWGSIALFISALWLVPKPQQND